MSTDAEVGSSALQARVIPVVQRMAPPVFAVVDGGHFDDIAPALAAAGVFSRSLFLSSGGRDARRHGPWLAPLPQPRDLAALLGVVGDRPAVVFWSCPEGDGALFSHLRRFNQARVPVWAAAGKPAPDPGLAEDLGYEPVLFRHWDPRVLGALLPVLEAPQFRRVLGPAAEIAFFSADFGGVKRVVADAEWPEAPPGPLTITSAQIEAMTGRRVLASHRNVAAYLRDVAPSETQGMSQPELQGFVREADASGRTLGVRTERGLGQWSYLMLITDGGIARSPEATEYVTSGPESVDAKLDLLLQGIARQLHRRESAA